MYRCWVNASTSDRHITRSSGLRSAFNSRSLCPTRSAWNTFRNPRRFGQFQSAQSHTIILIQPGSKDFRSLVWTSWVYLAVLQKVSKFLIKFTLWALQAFLGQCVIFTTLYIDKTANKQMKTNCDKSPQIMRKMNAESDPQAASGGHWAICCSRTDAKMCFAAAKALL